MKWHIINFRTSEMRSKISEDFKIKSYYSFKFQRKKISENIDKHLWLVCTPKSGSTWLSVILENLLKWKSVRLLPERGYREQEIDISPLLAAGAKGNVFSPHQHCRYSDSTKNIINALDSYVILLVRDLFDTIISIRDHAENESVIYPMAFMNSEIWEQKDEDEKLNFIIDMVIPWYFNFYCGWVTSDFYKNGKILMLTYNDLKQDTIGSIRNVLNFINEFKDKDEIQKALKKANKKKSRLNKAVIGRGVVLSQEMKEKVISYTKYYPCIDFSPFGL